MNLTMLGYTLINVDQSRLVIFSILCDYFKKMLVLLI